METHDRGLGQLHWDRELYRVIPGAPPFQFIAIAGARQVYDPAAGGGGGTDAILLEDGSSYLLLEDTSHILLES